MAAKRIVIDVVRWKVPAGPLPYPLCWLTHHERGGAETQPSRVCFIAARSCR